MTEGVKCISPFRKGSVLEVYATWRGRFSLDGGPYRKPQVDGSLRRIVRQVGRDAFEVLP